MRLTFLGTRGYIHESSPEHARHTSTLLAHNRKRVLIDHGEDWKGRLPEIRPDAIVLTHAHPDHAFGLAGSEATPIYARRVTFDYLRKHFPAAHAIEPRMQFDVCGITFEAFPVEHSIRCPAVGYRISAGGAVIFYASDVLYIHDRHDAMSGAQVYVGDGATITRPMVRRKGEQLFGHAQVGTQLSWCRDEGVPRAIFTHCGAEIVAGARDVIHAKLAALAQTRGVQAEIAVDGMDVRLPSHSRKPRTALI